MSAKYRSAITALKPLAVLLLIQPRMLTAFFQPGQAIDSCSAVDSHSCPEHSPRALSAKLLPSQSPASTNARG